MAGNDATQRQSTYLKEDTRKNLARSGSRLLHQRANSPAAVPKPEDGQGRRPTTIAYPVRTGGRATLVERNNPQEFLEFHWDPTTYDIKKSAKWTETSVEGGTDTLHYSGCSPTVVTCEVFLNQIGQPHATQRDVENSIAWLMNRLRPRTVEEASRSGPGPRNRSDVWLNVRDPAGGVEPPILILFGLRDGFECVLTDVSVKTEFQSRPIPLEAFGFNREVAESIRRGQNSPKFQASVGKVFQRTTRAILRARVGITLKEYVNSPDAEAEK